jgi:hypothetical protein
MKLMLPAVPTFRDRHPVAIVEIDPQLANLMLLRMSRFADLRSIDRELRYTDYCDHTAHWYGLLDGLEGPLAVTEEPSRRQMLRTAYPLMRVGIDVVWWTCHHCCEGRRVHSAELSRSFIDGIARGSKAA